MADLTAITDQVAKNTDAEKSAALLLNHLSDLIKAAGTDPAKLADLTNTLKSSADDLAAAVVANTQ